MKSQLMCLALLAFAFSTTAHARLTSMNATCPGNLEVHVDDGGPVYINGKEAALKRFNDTYFEARDVALGVTVSIMQKPDGSHDVSYTGKERANGICTVAAQGIAEPAPAAAAKAREKHPVAEKACLQAVAEKTNVAIATLSVIDVLSAEAGIQVTVNVPGADAPWSCTTDAKGKPWNVSYTGSEGAL